MNKRDHGGNIYILQQQLKDLNINGEILDFSANINPLGFPDSLRPLIGSHLENLLHYPDQEYTALRESLAEKHDLPIEWIWPGNGASELIFHLPRTGSFEKCIIPVPCYSDYLHAAKSSRIPVATIPLSRETCFSLHRETLEQSLDASGAILFVGQPSNPIGSLMHTGDIVHLADNFPHTLFCIDESFADFIPDYQSPVMVHNIAVIRSLTKMYAIPGLRLGYVLAHPDIIASLRNLLPTWSVNSLAAAVAPELLKEKAFVRRTINLIQSERKRLHHRLAQYQSFFPYPSRVNYLTVEVRNNNLDADTLAMLLLKRGISIRCLDHVPGLGKNFFRIAVRSAGENGLLLRSLEQIDPDNYKKEKNQSNTQTTVKKAKKQKKPLMVIGTGSNVGKSLIAAAFCRILYNDGIRVAPFKAQNMSLNSFVTAAGGEMGRAQVLQAQACFLDPDVRMNPVLLKPSSHTGSQVIVMGKPIGNMKAAEYHQAKTNLWRHVRDAYDSLALEYDFVVLEGAGSPAEINLKKNDIVNMNMAGYAGAVTLLAGDIDRGGVYAAFIGTMELLTPGERKLVAGYLVNKFRGDAGLLDMAHDYMLKYTGKPVLGVIPMIPDLNLPEEDSVTFKEQSGPRYRQHGDTKNKVVILVADFPHISNFTDIDALKREPDVCLKILSSSNHIPERWDLFILPGSKNVINDLCFLKESGIAGYLTREPEKLPGEVIGICGGFQMLGKMIGDPGNIESGISHEEGLSLLDMCTIMMKEKVLRQTTAEFLPAALTIKGYEIHHGETRANNLKPVIRDNNNRIIGCGNGTGNIWGTYLHGLFDNDQFRSWLLNRHRKNKHISGHGTHLSTYDINTEIDRLAAIVRSTINIDKIYRDLGIL